MEIHLVRILVFRFHLVKLSILKKENKANIELFKFLKYERYFLHNGTHRVNLQKIIQRSDFLVDYDSHNNKLFTLFYKNLFLEVHFSSLRARFVSIYQY